MKAPIPRGASQKIVCRNLRRRVALTAHDVDTSVRMLRVHPCSCFLHRPSTFLMRPPFYLVCLAATVRGTGVEGAKPSVVKNRRKMHVHSIHTVVRAYPASTPLGNLPKTCALWRSLHYINTIYLYSYSLTIIVNYSPPFHSFHVRDN